MAPFHTGVPRSNDVIHAEVSQKYLTLSRTYQIFGGEVKAAGISMQGKALHLTVGVSGSSGDQHPSASAKVARLETRKHATSESAFCMPNASLQPKNCSQVWREFAFAFWRKGVHEIWGPGKRRQAAALVHGRGLILIVS